MIDKEIMIKVKKMVTETARRSAELIKARNEVER